MTIVYTDFLFNSYRYCQNFLVDEITTAGLISFESFLRLNMDKIPRFFSVAISGGVTVLPMPASLCSGKSAGIPERPSASDLAATGTGIRGSAFKLPLLVFKPATTTRNNKCSSDA